ncbi:MAG TPA: type II toxin-antitoxin system HicB family antitoxin [Rhodocyclaceae bacterium]|nr:type II toxin-antitoxin system HicB family antitoxin [Rhodocyclaceae bacterium]
MNITLPRRVLARLDAKARAAGETQSGYIAKLTIEARPRARIWMNGLKVNKNQIDADICRII